MDRNRRDLYRLVTLPGKGQGLVATTDIPGGTRLIDEPPLVLLDPPVKRNEILKLLGCRLFSTVNMRATPDKIRGQIHQMILDKLVSRLSREVRCLN